MTDPLRGVLTEIAWRGILRCDLFSRSLPNILQLMLPIIEPSSTYQTIKIKMLSDKSTEVLEGAQGASPEGNGHAALPIAKPGR